MATDQAWRFRRRVNLLGQTFGLLTVVGETRKPDGKAAWECLCACGNRSIVDTWRLRKGKTKSCGCQQTVAVVAWTRAGGKKTHGCRYTRAYKAWQSMKERCLHPWHKSYKHYGDKGVTICQRWLDSFEAFLEDMGHPPDKHTIDRIDNTKGYEPGNCRWATNTEQQRNKSNNRLLTAFGETKPAVVWLEDPRCLANRTTLFKRLESGWDHLRAITQPMKPDCRRKP